METQSQREVFVEQASHSALLEGLAVSSELRSDSEHYVAGTISADELVELTRVRLGLVDAN